MSTSEDVIRTLFDADAATLVLYARTWLDRPDAEEAVQDAFAKLMLQSPAPDDCRAWLFRVVRNDAMTRLRAAKRRHRLSLRWIAGARDPHAEDPGLVRAVGTGAADAERASSALAGLREELREVVVLRIWAGLSLERVAGLLGSSPPTVHRRYQEALSQMKQTMEQPCPINP